MDADGVILRTQVRLHKSLASRSLGPGLMSSDLWGTPASLCVRCLTLLWGPEHAALRPASPSVRGRGLATNLMAPLVRCKLCVQPGNCRICLRIKVYLMNRMVKYDLSHLCLTCLASSTGMGVPEEELERLQSREQLRGLSLPTFTVELIDVVSNLLFRQQKSS